MSLFVHDVPLFMFFIFLFKREGTRDIIPLGTIPLATIEKFSKIVSFAFNLFLITFYILSLCAVSFTS